MTPRKAKTLLRQADEMLRKARCDTVTGEKKDRAYKLRKKAEMVLDLDFAAYAQEQLHNVWGGPKSRSYPVDGPDPAEDSMTKIGTLFFGESFTMGGDNHALAFATSRYLPPPVVDALATGHASFGSYEIIDRRPGYGPG